jgi:hypothetical protein
MDESDELFFKTERNIIYVCTLTTYVKMNFQRVRMSSYIEKKKANIAIVPYQGVKNSV